MIENKLKKIIQYEKPDNKLYRLSQEQTKTPQECHSFYPRIVNNTDITFSKSEITLLEKGLKYNLHKKKKNWLVNLALEAETAITLLPATDREYCRKQVSDHLDKLELQNKSNPQQTNHTEAKTA
jgi:hypothetical protein